jgi:hypothetical protein
MSNVDLTSSTLNPNPVQLQKSQTASADRNVGITQIVSAFSGTARDR